MKKPLSSLFAYINDNVNIPNNNNNNNNKILYLT